MNIISVTSFSADHTYGRVVVSACGPHALIISIAPHVLSAQVQRRRAFHVHSSIQVAVGEDGVADTFRAKDRSRK